MKQVYLAGPITGLTFGESQDGWRTDIALAFLQCGVKALTPLRGKDYLRHVGTLEKQYLHLSPLSSPHGIVRRDFNDVKNCDLVFANFLDAPGERASIGTAWEFGVAYALQKAIIAVVKPGSIHDHPFIVQPATYTFDNLEEALDAALFVLGV